MRIFISHASTRRPIAEKIAVELRAFGNEVFLDRDDLPPGGTYHELIRQAIERCELFLFLVSPESVEQGRYSRTELTIAQAKWPQPEGRVLPVMIADTPRDTWPPYLRNVTVFETSGDPVAETLDAVLRLGKVQNSRKTLLFAGLALAALGVVVSAVYLLGRDRQRHTPPMIIKPETEFEVYGNFPYPTWGETVPMRLVNVRPQAISSYHCRVEADENAVNIARIEHAADCSRIEVTMKDGPFLGPNGKLDTRLGDSRWERALVEVLDDSDNVVWTGDIRLASSNIISRQHFNLSGLPFATEKDRRPLQQSLHFDVREGEAYNASVEHSGRPLGEGFRCSPKRRASGSTSSSSFIDFMPHAAGSCSFFVKPTVRQWNSRRTARFTTHLLIEHPATGWTLKLDLVFIIERH